MSARPTIINMKRACAKLQRMFSTCGPSPLTSYSNVMSSKLIRQEFIDYFCHLHKHQFIRSSPVIPFGDSTVPFVNAGMNQFKSVFLGKNLPPCARAANSQKCIRVGGKHNDLDSVGYDTRHHTFFEMLGSWSFGDYFKEKACKMAWDLLTGPYRLDPKRLYVTYFKGDPAMGIEPDMETKNIWLQIGVPPKHILACGASDNFWEMGVSGPCGPCTEIYYDHLGNCFDILKELKSGKDNIIELWNLVFIQYNRELDGTLSKLPCFHIDTGMGFERLVAVLQGKISNYDTDLFYPLFKVIEKISNVRSYTAENDELNVNYRILADHARMITVALADGVLPDQNPKLRRVLRRALGISKSAFGRKGLVKELSNHVADSLADAYPEVAARLNQVHLVIDHEEDLVKTIRKTSLAEWTSLTKNKSDLKFVDVELMPGAVPAYKELENFALKNKEGSLSIPPDVAFKLYDTYGLDKTTMQYLCLYHGLTVDLIEFDKVLKNAKQQSKENHEKMKYGCDIENYFELFRKQGIKPTEDKYKYFYHKQTNYVFPPLECEIKGIIQENECVPESIHGAECGIILNKSNMYCEAGGQAGDKGVIILKDGTRLEVKDVVNIKGYLLHIVAVPDNCRIKVGDCITMEILPERRLGNMCNHTATHLLNAALHNLLTVTCQKSSHVTDSSLMFEFALYGENFSSDSVAKLEKLIQNIIDAGVPVIQKVITPQKLQELYIANQVTLVPGEVYSHENIYLIEIDANGILTSREACCGTHVLNTKDVENFCITSLKAPSAGIRALLAVTGIQATNARVLGNRVLAEVNELTATEISEDKISTIKEIEELDSKLQLLQRKVSDSDKYCIPYVIRCHCLRALEKFSKNLKNSARHILRQNMELEMRSVLGKNSEECKKSYIVHYLQCSSAVDNIPLQKATKMCSHIPVLLLAYSEGVVKARCCVPKTFICKELNAKLWMMTILETFQSQGSAPKGQDEREVFNMKGKYVREEELSELMDTAVTSAREFMENALQRNK